MTTTNAADAHHTTHPAELHDHAARHTFANHIHNNISLVAPAGTGKTTSITRRILAIAQHPEALTLLPRLVVVTYTNKAADELAARARALIQQHRLGTPLIQALQQARFSTIHGYCLSLIEKYGHHLGIPTPQPVTDLDLDTLIKKWEQTHTWPPPPIPQNIWQHILTTYTPDTLRQAVLAWPGTPPPEKILPRPHVLIPPQDIAAFLNCKRPRSRAPHNMRTIMDWAQKWSADQPAPLPDIKDGGKDFLAFAKTILNPVREWLQHILAATAAHAAKNFSHWRRTNGHITFHDQIALALELLHHPVAGPAILSTQPLIILDEAQDTDALQFQVLTTLASDPATLRQPQPALRPGAFCMVGDPQQSIYGDRASLAAYADAEQKILASGGLRLTLTTTFRCSRAVTHFVNQHTPLAINGLDGQVPYTPLQTPPTAAAGEILTLPVPAPHTKPDDAKPSSEDLAAHQADHLARWLAAHPPHTLGAPSAERIAILCPAKEQLHHISNALTQHNIPHINLSPSATGLQSPALAWLYALVHIILHPHDEFQIAGVLHEIFALPDPDAYHWKVLLTQPLTIHSPPSPQHSDHPAAKILAPLHHLHRLCADLYPHDCVQKIITNTALDQRLQLLFPDGQQLQLLHTLCSHAAQHQAQGLTLRHYHQHLKTLSRQPAPPPVPRPGHIQLLSCHAAKGLEWDAVILPYIFTPKRIPNNTTCRWLPTQPPRVITTTGEQDEDARDLGTLQARQEYQRLAYVALTRARRTLILLDDSLLHPPTLAEKSRSFGHLLQLHTKIQHFPAEPAATPPQNTAPKQSATKPAAETSPSQPTPAEIHTALAALKNIPRRILPHTLPTRAEDLIDARADTAPTAYSTQADETATTAQPPTTSASLQPEDLPVRYGLWWHHLMQHLPWLEPDAVWEKTFQTHLTNAPDPERARREWQLFLAAAPRQHIPASRPIIKLEEPFLWRISPGGDLVEGVIDFLLHDPAARRSTIIDWKTNTIRPEELAELADHYRPQLCSYRDAVAQLTGHATTAWLYSTATGLWSKIS
jgi:ATP-dependent exoDNAse (exonuclease V) beta subunit